MISRRDVLKRSFWVVSAGVLAPQLLACASDVDVEDPATDTDDLTADDCFINDLLRGALPEGATSTVSSKGRFHHYHFLSIPKAILEAPPPQGWATLSSLMVETLGIDDYFFQATNIIRQFHCHRVTFTRAELMAIAAKKKTTITAFIRSGGRPTPNHTFTFNDAQTMEQKNAGIIAIAKREGLKTKRLTCSAANRRSVTVFRGEGEETIKSAARLERLIQGDA